MDLRAKSNGTSIMVSGFSCPCHGWVSEDGLDSFKIIEPDKDGTWVTKDLITQLEIVVPLFQKVHPGCDIVFAFDNSSNHGGKAPDELNVNKMNLSDGGKKVTPRRDTFFGPENTPQRMTVPGPKGEDIARGIQSTLEGRGKWKKGMILQCEGYTVDKCPEGRVDCCARRMLSEEPDFKASKVTCWIQETVEKFGCFVVFYPKFHCELNYIEMVWSYVKHWLRRRCTYDIDDLRQKLPMCLRTIPLRHFRRYWQHCSKVMSAYRQDRRLKGPLLQYVMTKYKSHRRVPPTMVYSEQLVSYQLQLQDKEKRKYGDNAGRYAQFNYLDNGDEDVARVTSTTSANSLQSLLHVSNNNRKQHRKRKAVEADGIATTTKSKVSKNNKASAPTNQKTAVKPPLPKGRSAHNNPVGPARVAENFDNHPHISVAGGDGIMYTANVDADAGAFVALAATVRMEDHKWIGLPATSVVAVKRLTDNIVAASLNDNDHEWNQYGAYTVTSTDILRLRTRDHPSVASGFEVWLNDAIVDMRVWMLRIREDNKARMNSSYVKKHIALTYVWWKIIQAHSTGTNAAERLHMLRRIANYTHKDIDIFKMKIFLMPANIVNSHWIWFLLHPESKTVYAYDGFHNSYRRYYSFILNWLEVEATKVGCTFVFNRDEWTFIDALGPTQRNSYDCGMFMLKGIEYVCDNLPLTYSEDKMPYLRMDMMVDMEDGRIGRRQQDPFSTPIQDYAERHNEDLMIIEDDDEDEDDEAARNMNIDLDWSAANNEEQAKFLSSIKEVRRQ